MAGNSSQPGRSVVSKFSAILMTFRRGGSLTLSEIANLSGLPISTAHRMVNDLADWLVLEKDPNGRTYRPGVALQALLGSPCCLSRSLRDRAAPWLEDLHRAVGADVRFGVLEFDAVNYIEKRRNCAVSQFSTAATLPVHATAGGKVLLAYIPEPEMRQLVNHRLTAYTSRTIVDPDQLRWVLRRVRSSGFAIADRELRTDWSTIAAPVFGPAGRLVGALEVDVAEPAGWFDSVRPALSVAAASLSREFERPCEHRSSLATAIEGGPNRRPRSLDRRGPRSVGGPPSSPSGASGSVQIVGRRAPAGRLWKAPASSD
jgi:IclR family acetate operon transcriptional repressor